MALNDAVPSSATDVFKRNIEDTDRLLNTTDNVVNRVGVTLESFPNATSRVSDAADAAQIAIQADVDEAEAAKVAALASYAQWNSRGDWVTATAYAKGDIWNDTTTSTWYLVLNGYTSGATVNDDITGPNVTVLQGAGIQSFEGLSEAIAKITANPELFPDNSSVSISSNKTKAECVSAGVDFPDGNGGDYVITTGEALVDGRVIAAGTKQLKLITQKLDLPIENVTALRLFEPVIDGQECTLSGHTIKGIGGDPFYAILNDVGGVDNNGTKLMTAGGHSWNRREKTVGNIGDFGGGIGSDDTQSVKDILSSGEFSSISLPPEISISETITIPIGVDFGRVGGMCDVHLSETGTFTNNWAFVVNSSDQASPDVAFPNIRGSKVSNIWFRNTGNTATRRGILAFGGIEIKNIRGSYMTQIVKRPTGQYTDLFSAKRIFSEPVLGTEYQIELLGLGDCAIIEQCHFPFNPLNPGDGTVNGYRVTGGLSVDLKDNIGGNYSIENGVTATISGAHTEKTQILIDSSNVTITDSYLSPLGKVPVKLLSTNGQSYRLNLVRCEFAYIEGVIEYDGAQVQTNGNYDIHVEDCYRRYSINGQLDKSQLTGIRMINSAGAELEKWNTYSYSLSKSGRVSLDQEVILNFYTLLKQQSFIGMSIVLDSSSEWDEASGSYYYTSQNITDETRALGRNQTSPEQTATVTLGGSSVRLDVDYGDRTSLGNLKIYRGTTTGSYDEYVIIPAYSLSKLYDKGTKINGYVWQSRASAGVDTINTNGVLGIEYKGDNVVVNSATVPTSGVHQVGDVYLKTTPVASASQGWVCTGSPTTFSQLPALI